MKATCCSLFLAAALSIVNSATAANGYGSVAGQIVFEGEIPKRKVLVKAAGGVNPLLPSEDVLSDSLLIDEKSRGVANVFVWPDKVTSIHPRYLGRQLPPTLMKLDGFRVEPHCLLVQTGQELRFRATTVSTAHLRTFFNTGWNVLVPGKDGKDVALPPFERNERIPVRVTSNLQPWIEGWIKISDHPYAAMTDDRGNFQINWLPAGEYQFMIWHEKAGYLAKRLPVTIRDRKITRLDGLTITPIDVGLRR